MKIYVTQEDIYNGYRGHCNLCPVARAIARQTNKASTDVVVGLAYISLDDINGLQQNTPTRVQRFIRAFDNYTPVKPFAFILKEQDNAKNE